MRDAFFFGGGIDKRADPRKLRPDQAVRAQNCDVDSGALRPVLAPSCAAIEMLTTPARSLFRYQDETDWRSSAWGRTYSRFVEAKCWSDDELGGLVQVELDGVVRDAGRPPTEDSVYADMAISKAENSYVLYPISLSGGVEAAIGYISTSGVTHAAIQEYTIKLVRGSVGANDLTWLKAGGFLTSTRDANGFAVYMISEVVDVHALDVTLNGIDYRIYDAIIKVCLFQPLDPPGVANAMLDSGGNAKMPAPGDIIRGVGRGADEYYLVDDYVPPAKALQLFGEIVYVDSNDEFIVVNSATTIRVNVNANQAVMVLRDEESPGSGYECEFAFKLTDQQTIALAPIGSGVYKYGITFVDSDGVETSPQAPSADSLKEFAYAEEVPPIVTVTVSHTLPGVLHGVYPDTKETMVGGVQIDEYKTAQPAPIVISGVSGIEIPSWAVKLRLYRSLAGRGELYLLKEYNVNDPLPSDVYDNTHDYILAGLPLCDTMDKYPPVYYDTAEDTYERVGITFLTYHQGRFYGAYKNRVFWSEDSIHYWRLDAYFQFASDVTGLFSAANQLVILTEHEVHRVYGQGPENFSVNRVGTIGCTHPRVRATWNRMPLWSNDNGMCAFGGEEARVFTADVLKATDYNWSNVMCGYVLDDTYHLVLAGAPNATTTIVRWDLAAQKLLPDLVIQGRITAVHVDDAAGIAYAVLSRYHTVGGAQVLTSWIISLAGASAATYEYLTGRADSGAKQKKRYTLIYPQYSGGAVSIQVLVDGVARATVQAARDRHYLPDGLVGYDIQMLLTGTAAVERVEYEASPVTDGV